MLFRSGDGGGGAQAVAAGGGRGEAQHLAGVVVPLLGARVVQGVLRQHELGDSGCGTPTTQLLHGEMEQVHTKLSLLGNVSFSLPSYIG